MFNETLVWVRGAGELGSGVAHLLYRVGFSVFISEIMPPLAIRRSVTFSDALVNGSTQVEGVFAKRIAQYTLPSEKPWQHIPIIEDKPKELRGLAPQVLIDARMIKHYKTDYRNWADLVIGLGPGFNTARNCHGVIETMRGHDLARVIHSGESSRDTGVPGLIGGETGRRIVRAPCEGTVRWQVKFGDLVSSGQTLGTVNDSTTIKAPIGGVVRGLISPLTPVRTDMKIGDVDPRGASVQYLHISEKARAIAAGVFEAIVLHLQSTAHA